MNWTTVFFVLGLICFGLSGQELRGDETWYETKDGTTYRVTRRVEKLPVAETRMEQRTEAVAAVEYETEMREATRSVWMPVTRYVYEQRWHQWWNPFVEPYTTYEPRAITQWELRTQTVREPVTRRREIPRDRIVHVPVRELGFIEKPYEERVVVSSRPANESTTTDIRYAQRGAPAIRTAEPVRRGQPATTLATPIRR